MNPKQLSKSWAEDARKTVRAINSDLSRYPGQYIYGRLADGEWVRIVGAKSQNSEIMGKLLSSGKWLPINEWEKR